MPANYRENCLQLEDMGYTDREYTCSLLARFNNDMAAVIDWYCQHPDKASRPAADAR